MPRYRNAFGVVVNISEEKAARLDGLTPVEVAPPTPRKASPRRGRKPKVTEGSA